MTQSDLDTLLDMGFEKQRAELAVKKTGGLQGALQWLEDNQEKSLEELQKPAQPAEEDDDETKAAIAALDGVQTAKSLLCNECGKKFRNQDAAEFHASKSGHTDFAESTEEIAPLTAEEKQARLEELRQKLAEKRANKALQEKEDAKKNEKIRMKSTKEVQDLKEDLARKEQMKEAAKKRAEKLEEQETKKRIKAKIEADKEERRRKAEEAKARRENRMPESQPAPAAAAAGPSNPAAPKPAKNYDEAQLRLRLPDVTETLTFPADATLLKVSAVLERKYGFAVMSYELTWPKRLFKDQKEMTTPLRDLGLVPNANLIVSYIP